jgi:hypothetical protein
MHSRKRNCPEFGQRQNSTSLTGEYKKPGLPLAFVSKEGFEFAGANSCRLGTKHPCFGFSGVFLKGDA